MRDFEEHRYGLGERLREAKMKIINVELEKNSSAAAKAAAPIEPQIAAKDEIGPPPQIPLALCKLTQETRGLILTLLLWLSSEPARSCPNFSRATAQGNARGKAETR